VNVLPIEKQIAIIGALCEGLSIRSVERLAGAHRDTIMRLGVRVGEGCAALHDRLFRRLAVNQIQLDELWAFIGKKQRRLTPTDPPERGDCYTFLALDAVGKAIISYRTGKRDGDNARTFLTDLRSRVVGAPMLSSDAFPAYEGLIADLFGGAVHYGQIVKRYFGEPHKDAARRYSPGVVVGVERTALIGFPPRFLIGTSHVERTNLSVRMGSRRFTRLTNAYSKKLENHAAAVSLFVAHYNFCRVHETLRVTPAMALGISNSVWPVAMLIERAETARTLPIGRQAGRFQVIDGGAT
jgi:IS1 family transposase